MAGFTNSFPNLPGMLVEFKDGGLKLRTDMYDSNTKSLLILGTAEDGPVLEPVAVDINTASNVFGKDVKSDGVSNGSTLLPAFKQAWEAGCRDIRLMRVTGSAASTSLNTKDLTTSEVLKFEEDKGVVGGNELTQFSLSKDPIEGSVKLYIKGNILPTGYTVTGKDVSIQKNACSAGATVTATYQYYKVLDYIETLTVDATSKVTLGSEPVEGSVVVYSQGVEINESDFTVNGKEVSISSLAEGDVVDVAYKILTDTKVNATETGNGETTFVTATIDQVVTLGRVPVKGTVRVYINNLEISNKDAIKVDEEQKTVTVKKEFFARDSKILVSYLFEKENVVKQTLSLSSNFGGEVYNQCKVVVEDITDESTGLKVGKNIILTKPDSKKLTSSEEPLKYSTVDYPTLGRLMDAINADARNDVFTAKTDNYDCLSIELETTDSYLTGGESGLYATTQEMFDALSGTRDESGYVVKQGAYQLLEDYLVDWVVPVGVYADDYVSGINKNFGYELGLFCAVLSHRNKTTLGALSLRPCTDTTLSGIQQYSKRASAFENRFLMKDLDGNTIRDNDGNAIDLGRHLSIVVGPEPVYSDYDLGRKVGNAAIHYAAVNSNLAPHKAPTNKQLYGAKTLRFRFSNAQLNEITGNRLVTYKMKQLRNGSEVPFIVDGVTCAMPSSDYTRITTIKCVKETVDNVREVADPFLGEPSTIEQRNALAALLSKRLGQLRENGIIQDFAFQLVVSAQDYLLGQARIELTIVPPHELRQITTVVGLTSAL